MTHSKCLYTALESSVLATAAYTTDQTLMLEFRSGALYRYFAVPSGVFHALLVAESKGAYFNRNIRDRFRYQRLA